MKGISLFLTALMCFLTLSLSACGPSESTSSTQPVQNAQAPKQESIAPAASTAPAVAPALPIASKQLETKFVTIATGGASGPMNIIGTAIAEVYVKTFGVNSKTQTTGASVENANLIQRGKADMAFMMGDSLADAVAGVNHFQQAMDKVMQMAIVYPNYVQIVASKSAGIKKLKDLKGKRVAVGDRGSGVEVTSRMLLEAVGITYDDIKVDYLGYAAAADALKSGKLDAAFLTSGLPNASVMELQQGFDLQMVSVDKKVIDTLAKDKPFLIALEIPANTYGNAEPVPTAAILNALVLSKDISEEDGYQLTKVLFENLPALQAAHQAAKDIALEHADVVSIAPLHPGSARYYREQGIDMASALLTEGQDAAQAPEQAPEGVTPAP